MRDPHVKLVRFNVDSHECVTYRNPPPITFSNELGDFSLANGLLEVIPARHYATENQARQDIEPYLKAWEIDTDLNRNRGEIRFKFKNAELEDRNPPPTGSTHVLGSEVGSFVVVGCDIQTEIVRRSYPPPPSGFAYCKELEIIYQRWIDFWDGRERLQSMANFIISYITNIPGGEKEAARKYKISRKVFRRIGKLSSYRGTPVTARKAPRENVFVDLTDEEKEWLLKAVQMVIHRIGEHAAGGDFEQLEKSLI